jgi:uncharacterized protein (TIGR03083 family)
MTTRTFAPWVEPIAEEFRLQRADLGELARSIPESTWERPSPNPGWSYRDLLGHLATRDPRTLRIVLEAVVSKTPLDPSQFSSEEDAPVNEQLLEPLRDQQVEEVAAGIAADTDDVLDLLAKLTQEDEDLRQDGFPMSLGEALRLMPQHEQMHMQQLRTALEGAR